MDDSDDDGGTPLALDHAIAAAAAEIRAGWTDSQRRRRNAEPTAPDRPPVNLGDVLGTSYKPDRDGDMAWWCSDEAVRIGPKKSKKKRRGV